MFAFALVNVSERHFYSANISASAKGHARTHRCPMQWLKSQDAPHIFVPGCDQMPRSLTMGTT